MLQGLTRWLGYGLCHQIPERSFIAGGLQAPVCARDTGIYVGFIVALVVLALLHRGERPHGYPRWYVWLFAGLSLAALGWDGVTSYSGLRQTTNEIRLLTGLGVGYSTAMLVAVMINDTIWRNPTPQRILDPIKRFALWLASLPLTYVAIVRIGPALGIGFATIISLAILATLTAVNLVIVGFFSAFDRRALRWQQLLLPVAVSFILAVVEIGLAARLRVVLDALFGTVY